MTEISSRSMELKREGGPYSQDVVSKVEEFNYSILNHDELEKQFVLDSSKVSIKLFKSPVLESYGLEHFNDGMKDRDFVVRVYLSSEGGLYGDQLRALGKLSEIIDGVVFDIVKEEYALVGELLMKEDEASEVVQKLRRIFFKNDPMTRKLHSKFKKKIRKTHELLGLYEGSLVADIVTSPDYVAVASLLMQATVVESIKSAYIHSDLHRLLREFLSRKWSDRKKIENLSKTLNEKIIQKVSSTFKSDFYEIQVSDDFSRVEIKERSEESEESIRHEISIVLERD